MKSRDHGKKWYPCPVPRSHTELSWTNPFSPVSEGGKIFRVPRKLALWLHGTSWQGVLWCDPGGPQMGWKGNVRGRGVWDADVQRFQPPPRGDAATSFRIRHGKLLACIPPSESEYRMSSPSVLQVYGLGAGFHWKNGLLSQRKQISLQWTPSLLSRTFPSW